MDVKKFITIIFLLIANLSVIAHNVTPHHHHDGIVCMASMCADECCDAEAETSHQHHSANHCNGNPGDCELKNTMFRDSGNNNIQLSVPLLMLMIHHCCGLSSCHIEEAMLPAHCTHRPYLESYYTTYVSPTLGLRAPPHISFLG